MNCDFCNGTDVTWRYPCMDFVAAGLILDKNGKHFVRVPETLLDSTSDWISCNRCSAYIEADQLEELSILLNPRPTHQEVQHALHVLFRAFAEYRQGERQALSH